MAIYMGLVGCIEAYVPPFAKEGLNLLKQLRGTDESLVKFTQVAVGALQAISLCSGVQVYPKIPKVLTSMEVMYSMDLLKLPNALFGVVNASTVAREEIFQALEGALRQYKGKGLLNPGQELSSVVLADASEEKIRKDTKKILSKLLSYHWEYEPSEDRDAGVCYVSVDDLKLSLKRQLRDILGMSAQEAHTLVYGSQPNAVVLVNPINIVATVPSIVERICSLNFVSNLSFNIVNVGSVILQLNAWGVNFAYVTDWVNSQVLDKIFAYIQDQIGNVRVLDAVRSIDLLTVVRGSLIVGYICVFLQAGYTAVTSDQWQRRERALWDIFKSSTEIALNAAAIAKVDPLLLACGTVATKFVGLASVGVRVYRAHM